MVITVEIEKDEAIELLKKTILSQFPGKEIEVVSSAYKYEFRLSDPLPQEGVAATANEDWLNEGGRA